MTMSMLGPWTNVQSRRVPCDIPVNALRVTGLVFLQQGGGSPSNVGRVVLCCLKTKSVSRIPNPPADHGPLLEF
jgi:hypothetical protein